MAQLAERFGLELRGDGATPIGGVCTLQPGKAGCIGFLSNPKYRAQLGATQAAAVLVGQRDAEALRTPGLVAKDPYLAYARLAQLFDPDRDFEPGIHPSAVVAPDVRLGAGCAIGAQAVVESGAVLGEGVFVGPGCIVGRGAQIGDRSRLVARVHVGPR
ncbi:UNVERIFIED_CONTAM: UDP-3-O-(3-hydroxymyristoyl)glucosamine N-acyltransferase, partial [Salmonella enterica subsp. enterica serovar Weltevreden]